MGDSLKFNFISLHMMHKLCVIKEFGFPCKFLFAVPACAYFLPVIDYPACTSCLLLIMGGVPYGKKFFRGPIFHCGFVNILTANIHIGFMVVNYRGIEDLVYV